MERIAQREQEINELRAIHKEKLAELSELKNGILLENQECLQDSSER